MVDLGTSWNLVLVGIGRWGLHFDMPWHHGVLFLWCYELQPHPVPHQQISIEEPREGLETLLGFPCHSAFAAFALSCLCHGFFSQF